MEIGMNKVDIFWSRVNKSAAGGCWTYEGPKRAGYGLICVDGKSTGAHRYSFEINCGEIPSGKHIMHACDTPSCVNPEHLSIGTHSENMVDMYRKGRGNNKLYVDDIPRIRDMLRCGAPQKDIADVFGVSRRCISKVKNGASWAHV